MQTTLESFASLETVKRSVLLARPLEAALRRFLNFLIVREESLTDCNGEFQKISDKLSEDVRTWSSAGSSSDAQSVAYSLDESAYILPCRKAHPISSQELKILIEDSPEKKGLDVCICSGGDTAKRMHYRYDTYIFVRRSSKMKLNLTWRLSVRFVIPNSPSRQSGKSFLYPACRYASSSLPPLDIVEAKAKAPTTFRVYRVQV